MSTMFNRFSMKMKLVFGFSIIILISAAVAWIHNDKMNDIQSQMTAQNQEVQDQILAIQLKEKVQLLETMKMEIMFTKDLNLAGNYEREAAVFDQYITQIGETASNKDQREWRAKLKAVSSEYQNGFHQALNTIQEGNLEGEALDSRLKQIYDMSALYKDYIFEIVDQFNISYAETSQAAMEKSHRMLNEASQTSIIAAIVVLLFTVAVSIVLYRSFIHPIHKLQQTVTCIAEGDLTKKIHSTDRDELGHLSRSFDHMIDRVQGMLKNTQHIAASLHDHSDSFKQFSRATAEANADIVQAIHEMSCGAIQQAEDSEKSVQLLQEVNVEIHDITLFTDDMKETSELASLHTEQGAQSVRDLKTSADLTQEVVDQLSSSMVHLAQQTQHIGSISKTIAHLSGQTHVLALNAAIEAASAGSHGRGFAVIANEVRKLAKESNDAAQHITTIIMELKTLMDESEHHLSRVKDMVQSQHNKVNDTLLAFSSIHQSMSQTAEQIDQIHIRIEHTKQRNDNLVAMLQSVSAITEETAAGVEEVNATSGQQNGQIQAIVDQAEDMYELAMNLFAEINKFQMEDDERGHQILRKASIEA